MYKLPDHFFFHVKAILPWAPSVNNHYNAIPKKVYSYQAEHNTGFLYNEGASSYEKYTTMFMLKNMFTRHKLMLHKLCAKINTSALHYGAFFHITRLTLCNTSTH